MVRFGQFIHQHITVGIGGLFGYHALYFLALRLAPPAEAGLLNYLWPLLIVLLSPVLLPGYHLNTRHILGALAGFVGAALVVTGGKLSVDLTALLQTAGYTYVNTGTAFKALNPATTTARTAATAAICTKGSLCRNGSMGFASITAIHKSTVVPSTVLPSKGCTSLCCAPPKRLPRPAASTTITGWGFMVARLGSCCSLPDTSGHQACGACTVIDSRRCT